MRPEGSAEVLEVRRRLAVRMLKAGQPPGVVANLVGVHRGTLTLSVNGERLALGVELHVWDLELPDVLSFVPEMNCYGLPAFPRANAYYRLAHRHRTSLNCLGYNWRGEPHDEHSRAALPVPAGRPPQ